MPITPTKLVPYDGNNGVPPKLPPHHDPILPDTSSSESEIIPLGKKANNVAKEWCKKAPPLSPHGRVQRKVTQNDNIPESTPLKRVVEISHKITMDVLVSHASCRVIMFYTAAIAIYKLAVRSNPETLRNVRLNIGSAWEQMGQATGGQHAAHMNAGAGFIDNTKELVLEEIINEKGVTPTKERLMRAKGFTSEDIALLIKNNFDPRTVADIFEIRWPASKKGTRSVLNETKISDTLNLTTPIASHANLTCDKRAETEVRDKIVSLYHDLMHGYRTIEEAVEIYCQYVVEHFTNVIDELETYLPIIKKYETAFSDLKEFRDLPLDVLHKRLETLCSTFDDVLKYQVENNKQQQKENRFRVVILGENKKFVNKVKRYLVHGKNLPEIDNYLNKCGDSIHTEIHQRINHVNRYLDEAKSELKGTIVPDMKFVRNQLEKDYGIVSSDNNEEADLQFQMLAPKVPHGPEGDLTQEIEVKRKHESLRNSKPKRQRITKKLNFND